MKPRTLLLVAGRWSLVATFLLSGCAARVTHVTDLPAGVTEQQAKDYDTAVAGLHKIAVTTSSLRQAVIAVRNAGAFPNDEAYATVLQGISRIDLLQLHAADFLRQSPKNFGAPQKQQLAANIQQIAKELQAMNAAGESSIKNPDSLKQVNALIAEISGTAGLVLNLTF